VPPASTDAFGLTRTLAATAAARAGAGVDASLGDVRGVRSGVVGDGVSLNTVAAAATRAGVSVEDVLHATRALPDTSDAPVLLPSYIHAALEGHLAVVVAATSAAEEEAAARGRGRGRGRSVARGRDRLGGGGGGGGGGGTSASERLAAMTLPSVAALRNAKRFNDAAATLQAALKMRAARSRFLRVRAVVVELQRWSRLNLARLLRARLFRCKRELAVETLNLSMALAILMPIGRQWHAARTERRLRCMLLLWRRWSLGALHGHRVARSRHT
jgi:hypothetical protein